MRSRFLWRAFRTRFRDQKTELAVIRAHIRSGDLVCDIGAHKGSYLFWLSRWVKNGRAVAFEPQPALAAYLRAAMKQLGHTNVVVEAMGVAASTGEQELLIPSRNSPSAFLAQRPGQHPSLPRLMVPVVALDDYFQTLERITLIKIDAEGAELSIFHGAERILRDSRPLLVFECEGRHLEDGDNSIFDVFAFLENLGYQGEFVSPSGVRPLTTFDPDVHQRRSGPRFWDSPHYCNNFIFRHAG